MTRRAVVYTVGHSTRTFAEMLTILREFAITCLVDVRRFPASRAHPQWNRAAIIAALPPDIGYRWMPALGGRRHTAAGVPSPNGAWRVRAFRDYADHMATDAFRTALHELAGLAGRERPVIMCAEAVPWRCHRRLIADALIVAGVDVVDILAPGNARPAVLNADAHVEDGRLTYPPAPGADG